MGFKGECSVIKPNLLPSGIARIAESPGHSLGTLPKAVHRGVVVSIKGSHAVHHCYYKLQLPLVDSVLFLAAAEALTPTVTAVPLLF